MTWRLPLPRTLRSRLLLASTVVEVVLLSLLLLNSMRLINEALEASVASALEQTVPMLNAIVAPDLMQGDYAAMQDSLSEIVGARSKGVVYVLVLDQRRQIAARAGNIDPAALPPPLQDLRKALDQPVLHMQRPVTLAGQQMGVLRFGLSTEIIASARGKLLQQGLLIASVEVVITFLLLSVLGFWLTKSLSRLIAGSQAIAAGRYDQPVPVSGDDEIAQLSRQFNQMAESIQQKMQELSANESEYRALFEQAAIGIGHVRLTDYGWSRVNSRLAHILGCDEPHLLGQPFMRLFQPEDLPVVERARIQLDDGTLDMFEKDMQLQCPDGATIWVRVTASLHRNPRGVPQYYIVLIQDETDRKEAEAALAHYQGHLEELVANRTNALAAANRELESFSYSVSHDLKAPLRSIDGFSQILAEDYADRLDEAGQDYLARIRRGVKNMANLTDSLLALAKVGRAECRVESFDFSALVSGTVEEQMIAHPGRKVQVTVQPGMNMCADVALMRIVMQNLLDNAWKYTGKATQPVVEIGTFSVQGNQVYFVRDNGAGFNPAHLSRLFGVFQRLHTAEEFPGTGVGLATVQRIIHRHGGRIWAEAEPDKGACFYFTTCAELRGSAATTAPSAY